MTPEQHSRAKQLFNAVCDLPADEQQAHLHALTDDAETITFVARLLKQTQTDHPRVSQPILRVMSAVARSEIKVGDTLGAWKLVSEIGQGGMGTVFRAARSDGHFEQEAAVKLIHGIPSAKALEYLARERQILATLTHPNIARLYDGGATPGGQPYLVMEYVEGIAIDRYVRDNQLSAARILKLMLAVCDAISFAHQRLIVHCDIKPSNILVTPSERPMLLDFGIARLIGTDLIGVDAASEPQQDAPPSQASSKLTQARAFTPQYASPEQRSGQALTTATDVYSLGKMLAELVQISAPTGKPDTELAAIVTKATRDDVASRYATVAALANDIHRYLDQLPLAAIDAASVYLARKFAQRNWPWLAAACVFVVTVGVAAQNVAAERDRAQVAERAAVLARDGSQAAERDALLARDQAQAAEVRTVSALARSTSSEQQALSDRNLAVASEKRAVNERNRATEAEASAKSSEKSARQTNDFLLSVFESGSPDTRTGDPPASKMLASAEVRLDANLAEQPATQAELFLTLGHVQQQMGNFEQARKNYQRAVQIERTLNRPLQLAQTLGRLAGIDGDHYGGKEARTLSSEAVTLAERHAAPDSRELAMALMAHGRALDRVGNPAEATPSLRRAVGILEKIDPASIELASALFRVGINATALKQYDDAVAALSRAKLIREKKYGADHLEVLAVMEPLGHAYLGRKQYAEAESMWRHALAVRQKLHGKFNHRYTVLYLLLGEVSTETGRLREALGFALSAMENAENTMGRENSGYIVALQKAAYRYDMLGNEAEAIRLMEQVIALSFKAHTRPHPVAARYEGFIGRLLARAGRIDEAMPHLLAAYDMYKRLYGEKHNEAAEALLELAVANARANQLDEALGGLRQYELLLPQRDLEVLNREAETRALIATAQGRLGDAIRHYHDMERLTGRLRNPQDTRYWLAMLPRAELLARRNEGDDRAQSRKLADDILAKVGDKLFAESPMLQRLRQIAGR